MKTRAVEDAEVEQERGSKKRTPWGGDPTVKGFHEKYEYSKDISKNF